MEWPTVFLVLISDGANVDLTILHVVQVCKWIDAFPSPDTLTTGASARRPHTSLADHSRFSRSSKAQIHQHSLSRQHTQTPLERNMSARPPKAPGALKQIWYKWKTLRLPWRRQFLAGSDLSGNTFWEFKDAMNAQRFRRIVKYARAGHYSDVKISRKSSEIVARDQPRIRMLMMDCDSAMASMATTHTPRTSLNTRADV